MMTHEIVARVKTRLQEQQSRLSPDSMMVPRAEFDALWACVEVLAQALDGYPDVVLPDYFSTKDLKLASRIEISKRRED